MRDPNYFFTVDEIDLIRQTIRCYIERYSLDKKQKHKIAKATKLLEELEIYK